MLRNAKTVRIKKTKEYITYIGDENPKRSIDLVNNSRKYRAFAEGEKYGDRLIVTNIIVKPSLRNKGIGKYLINKLKRDTKSKKVYAAGIKKSARGFYSKLGIHGNAFEDESKWL